MENIQLTSRIYNTNELTAKEYISFCRELIVELKAMLPAINHIYTFKNDKRFYFDNDYSDIDILNMHEIISFNEKEDVFTNTDPNDKNLRENSKSWIGFNSLFYGSNLFSDKESLVTVSISSFGAFEKDQFAIIKIEFSTDYQSKVTFQVIEKIIKLLSQLTALDYAVAYTDAFFDEIFKSEYKLWMGWITFINNSNIINYLPTNILVKNIDKGYLFAFDEDIIDSSNSVQLEKTIKIRDHLGQLGFLNYPF